MCLPLENGSCVFTVREWFLCAHCQRMVLVCLLSENASCVLTVREWLLFAYC